MYVGTELSSVSGYDLWEISHHLLKFHEIIDVCRQEQKLLRLKEIELKLHTYCWGEDFVTRIKADIKAGGLWVRFDDVQIGYLHMFENWAKDIVTGKPEPSCKSDGRLRARLGFLRRRALRKILAICQR